MRHAPAGVSAGSLFQFRTTAFCFLSSGFQATVKSKRKTENKKRGRQSARDKKGKKTGSTSTKSGCFPPRVDPPAQRLHRSRPSAPFSSQKQVVARSPRLSTRTRHQHGWIPFHPFPRIQKPKIVTHLKKNTCSHFKRKRK